jgi:hypothetical protein
LDSRSDSDWVKALAQESASELGKQLASDFSQPPPSDSDWVLASEKEKASASDSASVTDLDSATALDSEWEKVLATASG